MPEFVIRYWKGPMKDTFQEKKLRIGKGFRMSFGHGAKSTFKLDQIPGISESHASIYNQGNLEHPSLVLRKGEGKTHVWVHGLPNPRNFIELKDQDFKIEHGMQIRIGPHTFEIIDPERLAKPLDLIYENGPLKGKFKPVRLAIASRNRMTIGHKKGASIALPKGPEVEETHAHLEKHFRRFLGEPEIIVLHGDRGTTIVQSPYGPAYPISEGHIHELEHGTTLQVGPHQFRVVNPEVWADINTQKAPPKKPSPQPNRNEIPSKKSPPNPKRWWEFWK